MRKGLIVAVFSVLALLTGIAAAVKLSTVVALSMKGAIHISSKWLPVLAFVLVFIIAALVVRWAANLIKEAIDFVLLGWVDKLAGAILYICIYTILYSVLLFYATRLHIISQYIISSSVTYSFIEPWGPFAINTIGKITPVFENMFIELENFFDRLA